MSESTPYLVFLDGLAGLHGDTLHPRMKDR